MSPIDYRIPKIENKAEILIESDTPKEYVLFLNEFSRYRKGQETISEFLNKDKDKFFIPLKDVETGDFIVVNIDEIVYVQELEKETEISPAARRLTLYLTNHIQLEVDYSKLLPESHARVLDYLNDKNQFTVFYNNERKVHINKNKILKVKEKEL